MTASPQTHRPGGWVLDRRGLGRGVRVTHHPELGVVNLSVWRESTCVGTVHLTGAATAQLIGALSTELAQLGAAPSPTVGLVALEERITALERRRPAWRRAIDRVTGPRRTPLPPPPYPLHVVR